VKRIMNFRKNLPGLLVALATGLIVWFLSSRSNVVDPLVAGILCGMILGTILGKRQSLASGLAWAPKVLIPPGIILYGARLRFNFDVVSPLVWLQILVGLVIVVWLARTVGKWFKLPDATSLLLAVGTAVCGASAIVIASEAVNANRRDTATSLLVITIWGLVGLGLLPFLAKLMEMNIHDQALLYATTLQQTGLVKTAAIKAGGNCLSIALAIKTARIVTIIPLLFIVGTLYYFPSSTGPSGKQTGFKVKIPWYLWAFLVSGLCFSFIPQLKAYSSSVHPINTLIWTMAMVSIGLTVDAKSVIRSIGRPLLTGLIIWIGLLVVFLYTYLNA
jgi:uncharacterized integral membrane protein (TIGR00698 family)